MLKIVKAENLVPLRSYRLSLSRKPLDRNLTAQHQYHHQPEEMIPPRFEQVRQNVIRAGYDFFGRYIETARTTPSRITGFVGGTINLSWAKISEVAASPLYVKCNLPNLGNVNHALLDQRVDSSLMDALKNRVKDQAP